MARTTQTPRTTQLQVRLTEDEAGWLRAHAEERRTTVSGVVVGWIADARRREMETTTTLHDDGTVTYWSVYEQVWRERAQSVPDRDLAAMGQEERLRVIEHLGGVRIDLDSPVGPRVKVYGDVRAEDVLAQIPAGWTVHDDDWQNGVTLTGGAIAYPLTRVD